MADVMDGVQEREQAERERHINNARSRITVLLVSSVKYVTYQFRKPDESRFRVWACA